MSDNFTEWMSSKAITGGLAAAFKAVLAVPPLNEKANVVDMIARGALRDGWAPEKMASALQIQGADVTRIESLLGPSSSPAPATNNFFTPISPNTDDFSTAGPASDAPEPTYQAPEPSRAGFRPASGSRADAVRARRAGKSNAKSGGGSFLGKVFGNGKKDGGDQPQVSPSHDQGDGKPAGKNLKLYGIVAVIVCVLGVVGYFMYSSNQYPSYNDFSFDPGTSSPNGFDFADNSPSFEGDPFVSQDGGQPPSQSGENQEVAPQRPPPNALNFKGSLTTRGFLGAVQALIFVLGIGILVALVGDIIYREQKLDGIVAVAMAILSIAVVLPNAGIEWVGVIIFLLELAFVIAVSLATGKDFSPLAAYFLLVAVFGGLVFTRIGAIQSIFPMMLIAEVPPIIQLGYYFSTMNFSAMAFSMIVYLLFLIGTTFTVIESVRPSGEDKSSRWGSLAAGGFGLVTYFIFLLAVHLAPWVSFLIAFLLTVAGSAALRSQPAKQWVAPQWSVRSPYDGAMLFTAILLLIVVIVGQQWWLVGVVL